MNEKNIVLSIVFGVAVAILGIQYGALPWAIGGGVTTSVLVLFLSRQLKPALSVGGFVAMFILATGAASVIMPGWHQGLLEALRI